jgi:hypothetical protein
MRHEQTLVGPRARESAETPPPFGPGFARRIVHGVERLELHVTDCRDRGGDFCEWRAFDGRGLRLGTIRVRGY